MGLMDFITKGITKVDKKQQPQQQESLSMDFSQYQPVEQPVQPVAQPALSTMNYTQPQQYESSSYLNNALNGHSYDARNILVSIPNTDADITKIVQNLQNGEACVACLETIPLHEAQRRLDFLSGVVCAMKGKIEALDQYKYILTPPGLGVRSN